MKKKKKKKALSRAANTALERSFTILTFY